MTSLRMPTSRDDYNDAPPIPDRQQQPPYPPPYGNGVGNSWGMELIPTASHGGGPDDHMLRRRRDSGSSEKPTLTVLPSTSLTAVSQLEPPNAEPSDRRPSIVKQCDVARLAKTQIFTYVKFMKITDINAMSNSFTADVVVQNRWREQALDNKRNIKSSEIDWTKYWSPKLMIENAVGEQKKEITKSVEFDGSGRATVMEQWKITGTFRETMELDQFPFDTQDLTVTVSSERLMKEIDFKEDPARSCTLNTQTFRLSDWQLHERVFVWNKIRIDENRSPKTRHAALSACCKVSRRPGFFIYNIILMMCLLSSLTFATFSVNITVTVSRLQLQLILIMTTITFKLNVINPALPLISYLTYLDKYVLVCISILCGICVWHALIPYINTVSVPPTGQCCSSLALWLDQVALIIAAATYIAFQSTFFIIIGFVVKFVNDEVGASEGEK